MERKAKGVGLASVGKVYYTNSYKYEIQVVGIFILSGAHVTPFHSSNELIELNCVVMAC